MNLSKVLVIYKKSAYQIYFQEQKNPIFINPKNPKDVDIHRFKLAHDAHYDTLAKVKRTLHQEGIKYTAVHRALRLDYSKYDLVVAVGGDGTFLEAARRIKGQRILGVNSDPDRSEGHYCAANAKTFRKILHQLRKNRIKTKRLNRIQLSFNGKPTETAVLNEVLICHRNPAAMSRYWIEMEGFREEQRSSGIWICTAAGSTGAMKSAGGKKMAGQSKKLQYRPRELYWDSDSNYRFKGGFVPADESILLGSLMRDGMIYADGAHCRIPFQYGNAIRVSNSTHPLQVIAP